MVKTTVKIDGMMCGMCESHINTAIRNAFPAKKVTASHTKGEAVILSEEEPDPERLKEVINATGYEFRSAQSEPYVKKGFLWF